MRRPLATLGSRWQLSRRLDRRARRGRGVARCVLDAALGIAVFAASLALLAARGDSGADTRELDALGVLLAALASLPLVAWRARRWRSSS